MIRKLLCYLGFHHWVPIKYRFPQTYVCRCTHCGHVDHFDY